MTEHGSASNMSEVEPSAALAPCATRQNSNSEMAGLDLTEQSASIVTSKDRTSDMSYLDPAEKPASFVTSQDDASDTAALDLTDQPFPFIASKFRASDMADVEPPAPFVTSQAGAGDAALDLTGEPAPSGRQTGGDPNSQPTGDDPSGNQPTHGEPTSDINAEKLLAEVAQCTFIYTGDYSQYLFEMEKQKQWQYVCERLFPEWNTFSARKMKETAIRVQNHWAKLREPIFKKHAEKSRRIQKQMGRVKSNSHPGFRGYSRKTNEQMEELDLKFVNGIFSDCAGVINQQLFTASLLVINKMVQERYVQHPLPKEEVPLPKEPAMPSTSAQNYAPFPNVGPAMPSTFAQNYKVPFPNVGPAMPSTSAQNYVPSPNVGPAMPSTSAQNYVPSPNVELATPSTSAQNYVPSPMATPSTSTHNNHPGNMADNQSPASFDYSRVSQMFPFKPGELEYKSFLKYIQPSNTHTTPNTDYEYIPPETGLYKKPETAYNLYTLLTHLDYDQQRAVWPKLVDVIAEGARNEPKKIKILQNELIDDGHRHSVAATGPAIILQEQFTETDPLFVQETLAEPELMAQKTLAASELTGQETLAEPEEEQEPIYPCTYGRPTNAQGEIIYPETDHEDLDEE